MGRAAFAGAIRHFFRDRERHVQFDTIEYRQPGEPIQSPARFLRLASLRRYQAGTRDARARCAACRREGRRRVRRRARNAVADTPELRAAHAENLPRVTEFLASVGQNLALYEKYKAIAAGSEHATLTAEQKKMLSKALRSFRLSGAELPEDRKPRFARLQEEQAALSKAFSDHVLDATNAFSYLVKNESELSGLPKDGIEAAHEAARRDGNEGWKFTLHFPSYFPVLQYAEHRPLREAMFRAYVTRASELGAMYGNGKPEWDNTANIVEQLKLRAEEAHALGYQNFAEVSLAPKMAESPAQVVTFLED